MKFDKATYFVAVKIFLEHQGKFLVLKDNFGDWDIPGGRIKESEFNIMLEKIIVRKMKEELGDSIKYKIEKPIVFMRHKRREAVPGNPEVRIFAIGYKARYLKGGIRLSGRHTEQLWISKKTFKPEKYFKGGWLAGVREYLKN